jgi:hypothetical protein
VGPRQNTERKYGTNRMVGGPPPPEMKIGLGRPPATGDFWSVFSLCVFNELWLFSEELRPQISDSRKDAKAPKCPKNSNELAGGDATTSYCRCCHPFPVCEQCVRLSATAVSLETLMWRTAFQGDYCDTGQLIDWASVRWMTFEEPLPRTDSSATI